MGKWFLTDCSSTVGRILMIFSADPIKFQFQWNDEKISLLAPNFANLASFALRVKLILANFDLLWPRLASFFCGGILFLSGNICHGKESTSNARGIFEPNSPPIGPKFGQNRDLGKIFPTPKQIVITFFSSRSYKSLKFEFVCCQYPPL